MVLNGGVDVVTASKYQEGNFSLLPLKVLKWEEDNFKGFLCVFMCMCMLSDLFMGLTSISILLTTALTSSI